MIIIYILLSVILLFFLIILIPHRFHVKIDYTYKDNKLKVKENNYFVIKLFSFLPVAKIKFLEKLLTKLDEKDITDVAKDIYYKIQENKKKNEQNPTKNRLSINIFTGIKVKELMLALGFNLDNYVINSYVVASINTLLCMYININHEKFNFKKLYYKVYTVDKPLEVYLEMELQIHFAKIIYETIKNKV